MSWLEDQLERPGRTDYYLMQLTGEVRRSWVQHPGRVRTEDFRLRFEPPGGRPPAATPTPEQEANIAKARWLALVGVKPETHGAGGGAGGSNGAAPGG